MGDIITNAVRAGCVVFYEGANCEYPCCDDPECSRIRAVLKTAARHAAEAMREEAADKCEAQARGLLNVRGRTNQVDRHTASVLQGRATAIRAIPIEGETK